MAGGGCHVGGQHLVGPTSLESSRADLCESKILYHNLLIMKVVGYTFVYIYSLSI